MQHTRIAAALVLAHRAFLFKHLHLSTGKSLRDAVGRGQPQNAAADDRDIGRFHVANSRTEARFASPLGAPWSPRGDSIPKRPPVPRVPSTCCTFKPSQRSRFPSERGGHDGPAGSLVRSRGLSLAPGYGDKSAPLTRRSGAAEYNRFAVKRPIDSQRKWAHQRSHGRGSTANKEALPHVHSSNRIPRSGRLSSQQSAEQGRCAAARSLQSVNCPPVRSDLVAFCRGMCPFCRVYSWETLAFGTEDSLYDQHDKARGCAVSVRPGVPVRGESRMGTESVAPYANDGSSSQRRHLCNANAGADPHVQPVRFVALRLPQIRRRVPFPVLSRDVVSHG